MAVRGASFFLEGGEGAVNTYERIFGAGPRGLLISLALLALTWQVETAFGLPDISDSHAVRWVVFGLSAVGTLLLAGWSAKSLPPATRGKELVTAGPYKYVRHPVYAAFLSCFNWAWRCFLTIGFMLLGPSWFTVYGTGTLEVKKN